jgi:hypothetical protein
MNEARPIDIYSRLRFKKTDTGLILEFPTKHSHSRLTWKDRIKLFLGKTVTLNDSIKFDSLQRVRSELKAYIISG